MSAFQASCFSRTALSIAIGASLSILTESVLAELPDISYDMSTAHELSLQNDTTANPTDSNRLWYGDEWNNTSGACLFKNTKLTGSTDQLVDAIGSYAKSDTRITQAIENYFYIADESVNIRRAIGLYIGHGLSGYGDTLFEARDNVTMQTAGQVEEVWGVLAAESGAHIHDNHAVMTGGKATFFGGVGHAQNRFEILDSSAREDNPSESVFEVDIHNNRTTVTGGEIDRLYGVYQNREDHMNVTGETKNNLLEIYGGKITNTAYGVITNVSGLYSGNEVYVEGVDNSQKMIGSLLGLYFEPAQEERGEIEASNNKMDLVNANISNVTLVNASVNYEYGKLLNNEITVDNSVTENVSLITVADSANQDYEVSGNYVNLRGETQITRNLSFIQSNSANVHDNGLTAQGVHTIGQISGQYDTMILTVGEENNAETGSPILTLTNGSIDLSNVNVTVDSPDGLDPDGNYQLIHTAGGNIHVDQGTEFTTNGTLFTKTTFTFTEDFDKNSLTTDDLYGEDSVVDPEVTPTDNSKTLSDSILGSIAVINQGASFVAGEGMQAMESASLVKSKAVFGTIGGGKTRYDTGSRVDVDSMSLVTGAVTRVTPEWMVAGFIEAGFGNSESNAKGSTAEGDHDYYGIGAATRYRFDVPFYVDGSLRFGMASTEFSGRYTENSAHYDADSLYGSAHVGMGYVFDLTKTLSLDVYGRYIFTYLEGDTVSLGTVDHEKLVSEDTLTHTMQVGAMLRGKTTENIDWHFGLAYEHVADGDAESTVYTRTDRVALNVPTLEGDSGIVDMGITIRSTPTDPMALDLGIKAYAGDVQGVMGSATLSYAF